MSAPATTLQPSAAEGRPRRTHFTFEHNVFGLEGAHFALTSDTREAAFHLLLGDLHVAILLPTLCQEFDIKPDSSDAELLGVVERSLRYVKEIRPNDSIPREILDGTASWSVEDRHRLIAKGWLSLQIASWLTGEQAVSVDRNALERLVEDPLTKKKVDEAFGAITESSRSGGRAGKRSSIASTTSRASFPSSKRCASAPAASKISSTSSISSRAPIARTTASRRTFPACARCS